MQHVEDLKAMEEEEEGLIEVMDRLFVIIVVKLDILCASFRTQHIHLVNIANSSIM